MFFPLHDSNPRIFVSTPWVTYGLIISCVLGFFWQQPQDPRAFQEIVYGYAFIPAVFFGDAELPAQIAQVPTILTPISYIFLHGSLMHLLGNMLFLWVFGDNIEDAMGHGKFIGFFLLCGAIAAAIHGFSEFDSRIPTIGASGAISGVLGAYLLLHPYAKVLVPIIVVPLYIPAFLLLGFWFLMQFMSLEQSGVAWWAHIGGFVAGMALIPFFKHKNMGLLAKEVYPKGVRVRRDGAWNKRNT